MPMLAGAGSTAWRPRTMVPSPPTAPTYDPQQQMLDLLAQQQAVQAQMLAYNQPQAQTQYYSPQLSIPRLSLSNPLPIRSVEPAPTPAPVASGGGGYGGSTARSGNWGASAYGYGGRTGVKGTRGNAKYGFQPEMWSALAAANRAMAAAGLGTFGITDGWRSYGAQVSLKKRKPTLAATPGRSVHGLGLAADLRLSAKQQRWLEQNGAKFGLRRLPSESWHWQLAPSAWKRKW